MSRPAREFPIGFSPAMVNAILEGRKTETRRLPGKSDRYAKLRPGDRLYVREPWQIILPVHGELFEAQGRVHRNVLDWNPCGGQDDKLGRDAVELAGEIPKSRPEYRHRVIYRASHTNGYRFRPGIHMPKWMSRILLELTEETRLEPVNVITPDGCRAEGVEPEEFPGLWDSLHKKPGTRFGDGPPVRVIVFGRVCT
jgi:hypothetical protein